MRWSPLAALFVAPLALAQDPWGPLEPDADEEGPWGTIDEPAEEPDPAVPAEAAEADDAAEPEPEPLPARPARDPNDGHAPSGLRIAPWGAGSGVGIAQELVVGSTGGTNATTVAARWSAGDYGVTVGLPFTAYRNPDGRTTDIGNLQLDGWYRLKGGGALEQAILVETHIGLGDPAWTWVNRPDDLWPGGGVDVSWQARREGDLTVMYRAGVGLHGARGYEPFPNIYPRFQAAAGLDRALPANFGLVGEASLAYWDLSPLEATGLVRWDPVPGLRARAGLVMPLFVWFGWTPSDQRAGIRETTLLIDIGAAI